MSGDTAQNMKFLIKEFFSKCNQIRRKRWIWSHLLKKSLIENFVYVQCYLWKNDSEMEETNEKIHENCLQKNYCVKSDRIQRFTDEDLQCKSPYSVQMRENTDQKNLKYGLFLCSELS